MANPDLSGAISAARKAGMSDDQIVQALGKTATYGPAFQAAASHGYASKDILDHFQPTDSDTTDPSTLKPNDELGFVNGGTKVMNNILGAGSQALQHAGVPADVVHGIGGVIRNPVGSIVNPVASALGAQGPVIAPMQNNDQVARLNAAAAQQGQRPGKLGIAAGEAAATLPVAVGAGALAPEGLGVEGASAGGRALSALAGRGLSGAAVQGAAQGLETSNPGDNLAVDAAAGGAGGALLHQGMSAVGAFVAPRFNDAMQSLIDLGQTKFSPAQLADAGNSALQKGEDALRSTPALGSLVEGAQRGAHQDFQRAYLQNALDTANTGVKYTVADSPTHQTYQDLTDAFTNGPNGYRATYAPVQLQADQHLFNDPATQQTVYQVLNGAGRDGQQLAQKFAGMFSQAPQNYPGGNGASVFNYGSMSGDDLLGMHQILDQQAQHLLNPGAGVSPSPAALAQANEIRQAQGAMDDALTRQFPDQAAQLQNLDQGYAQLSRAREAVTAPGSRMQDPGQFTPRALLDKTLAATGANQRPIMGANGTIPGQDVAEAANQVLSSKLGDSGTAMRSAVQRMASPQGWGDIAAGIAGAGAGATPFAPALAAPAAIALPYAPGVRDLISNTVVGNSQNPMLQMARQAFDPSDPLGNRVGLLNQMLKAGLNPYTDLTASPVQATPQPTGGQ